MLAGFLITEYFIVGRVCVSAYIHVPTDGGCERLETCVAQACFFMLTGGLKVSL